jgi:hypothetical protein
MRYEARIVTYDVMDRIAISMTVRQSTDAPEHGQQTVYHKVTTVPGTGENDPRAWLLEALVAAAETL